MKHLHIFASVYTRINNSILFLLARQTLQLLSKFFLEWHPRSSGNSKSSDMEVAEVAPGDQASGPPPHHFHNHHLLQYVYLWRTYRYNRWVR